MSWQSFLTKLTRGFKGATGIGSDLHRLEMEKRVAGGVAHRQQYADELLKQGRYEDAILEYQQALTGLYQHDPKLMHGLAQAQFSKGDVSAARETLDALIRENPEGISPDGRLLHARALEVEGNIARALEEYQSLSPAYPGAEAQFRYAQLLKSQGRAEEARKVVHDLLEEARIAPDHYRRAQREWLSAAERLL